MGITCELRGYGTPALLRLLLQYEYWVLEDGEGEVPGEAFFMCYLGRG